MSGTTDWIAERRKTAGAEIERAWEAYNGGVNSTWSGACTDGGEPIDDREQVAECGPEAAAAIVDAHNSLPCLLDTLQAVLDLHRECPLYDGADDCPNRDDERHADQYHVESAVGEWHCEARPLGYSQCTECLDVDEMHADWPCATVRAVAKALGTTA